MVVNEQMEEEKDKASRERGVYYTPVSKMVYLY